MNSDHKESKDPLLDLVLDARQVDRTRIAVALGDFIGIDATSGRIVPKPPFTDLTNRERILVVLLATQAAHLIEKAASPAMASKDLPGAAGVPPGSARPILKHLREEHRVSQTKDGHYYLAAHDVLRAVEDLEGRAAPASTSPLETEDSSTPPAPRPSGKKGRRKRTGTRKAQPATPKDATKRGQRRSATDSPTTLVRALVTSGYFDTPKTITDVQDRLRQKHARKVPNTSLSPILGRLLKAGVLDRETNEEKVFEYTKVNK